MTQTPAIAPRRFHFGRYLLILILALVLLLVGFVGRDYIPVSWLRTVRIGRLTLFPKVSQVSQTVTPPTEPTDSMAGMDHSSVSTTMPGLTASPTDPATTSGGVVTVLTLTPSIASTATEGKPTSTATVASQESATPLPQPATPVSTATVKATETLPPSTNVPEGSAEKIRTDLDDLYRILQTTIVITETFQRGQPTEAELTALKAQLNVIDQRMEKLKAELQAIESNGDSQILLGQTSDLLELMRQAVAIVQSVLAGPTIDSAILTQTQKILEQLLAMLGQLQGLVPSTQDTVENTPVVPTATPSATATLAPTATATLVPSATATPTTVSSDQLNQMETMLSQMIEQLGSMQSALDQKQTQVGSTPTP